MAKVLLHVFDNYLSWPAHLQMTYHAVYDTMEEWMEKWPQQCKQLSMKDYYGNTLYIDVHPLPEGNMTLEVYTDNKCTILSEEMDLQSYIMMLYSYYGYNQKGEQVAQQYAEVSLYAQEEVITTATLTMFWNC